MNDNSNDQLVILSDKMIWRSCSKTFIMFNGDVNWKGGKIILLLPISKTKIVFELVSISNYSCGLIATWFFASKCGKKLCLLNAD